MLTARDVADIKSLDNAMKNEGANPRDVKIDLAKTLIEMYHSKEEANAAESEFLQVFSKKEVPDDMPIKQISGNPKLVDWAVSEGIFSSKKEMVRLIQQGAVSLDAQKIQDISYILTIKNEQVLKIGKRKFFKLKS